MMLLAGLWVAWRRHFTPGGIQLGAATWILGPRFLLIYLLALVQKTDGDMKRLLLGDRRAAA